MLLSLITAGVMVFLIACALVGLIVKQKMVATKNARGYYHKIINSSLLFQLLQKKLLMWYMITLM